MLRKSLWILAFLIIQFFPVFSYGEEKKIIKKTKIEKIKKKKKDCSKSQKKEKGKES